MDLAHSKQFQMRLFRRTYLTTLRSRKAKHRRTGPLPFSSSDRLSTCSIAYAHPDLVIQPPPRSSPSPPHPRAHAHTCRTRNLGHYPVKHTPMPFSRVAVKRKSNTKNPAISCMVNRFHAFSLSQRHRRTTKILSKSQKNLNQVIDSFFREADRDQDGLLNTQEFRFFLTSRFCPRKILATDENNTIVTRPTSNQLKLVMLGSAIPFIGFGFVDNMILLIAGDQIEDYFHESFHYSILCAGLLGNTVSDVIGLSLGGIIETLARKLGIPDPKLSRTQANMSITHWANFFAAAGGITLGCLLGMVPLLFMKETRSTEKESTSAIKRQAREQNKLEKQEERAEKEATSFDLSTVRPLKLTELESLVNS